MSPAETSDDSKESLSKIVLMLLWELAKLIVPIAAVALLHPLAALAVALSFALLTGLCALLKWPKVAKALSWLLTAAVIGLCFSVFNWMSSWWGIPVCVVMLLVGMAGVSSYERYLGLAKASDNAARVFLFIGNP